MVTGYTEGKANDAATWYQKFLVDPAETFTMGSLVRLSADLTVSAVKAAGGAIGFFDTGADSPVGVCMSSKTANYLGPYGDHSVEVRMFGKFQRQSTVTVPGNHAPVALGDNITLKTGAVALVIKAAGAGAKAEVLVP